jgi:hypothetical protein
MIAYAGSWIKVRASPKGAKPRITGPENTQMKGKAFLPLHSLFLLSRLFDRLFVAASASKKN